MPGIIPGIFFRMLALELCLSAALVPDGRFVEVPVTHGQHYASRYALLRQAALAAVGGFATAAQALPPPEMLLKAQEAQKAH